MVGTTVSHYRILERIGSGGMGVVYKAEDSKLGRPVALKFLPDDLSRDRLALERLHREARTASALNHPHICTIYDVDEHEGHSFIAMELLKGVTLSRHIDGRPLPTADVLRIAIQIADALDAAHSEGIVHRDLKPANIFITERGQAKVLDFGLAHTAGKRAGPESDLPTAALEPLTAPGTAVGTIAYMSPEQALGKTLDRRTDIFSFGVILYEMVTGRQPFAGETTAGVFNEILNREPIAPVRLNPEVPPRLEEIINRSLEKDLAMRYQSAADLRSDLERLRRDLESRRSGVVSAAPATSPNRRWMLQVTAGAAALAIVSTLAYRYWPTAPAETIDSVVVLPFVNEGGLADTEYLSDGVTESIINALSRLPNLRVIPRNTAFRYKGKESDLETIRKDLDVRAVVTGRVLQRGTDVTVGAELVDMAKNAQLWGNTFTRRSSEVMAIQEAIAHEVVEKLQVRLSREDQARMAKRYTQNPKAYELYLKGRHHWSRSTEADNHKALDYFRQAIDLDDRFALAYAGLSDVHAALVGQHNSAPADGLPDAEEAARRAVQLDDGLAEAHAALGRVAMNRRNWKDAELALRRSLQLSDTAEVHAILGHLLVALGRDAEAISEAEAAARLSPASPDIVSQAARVRFYAGQRDEGLQQVGKAIGLDPGFGTAHWVLGVMNIGMGQLDAAIEELEKTRKTIGDDQDELASLGYVYARVGRTDEARKILAALNERARSKQHYVSWFSRSFIHFGLSENDKGFALLESALAEGDTWFVNLTSWPFFDSIRTDARYRSLVSRAGLPD